MKTEERIAALEKDVKVLYNSVVNLNSALVNVTDLLVGLFEPTVTIDPPAPQRTSPVTGSRGDPGGTCGPRV